MRNDTRFNGSGEPRASEWMDVEQKSVTESRLFYTYWNLPTIKRVRKVHMKYSTNQSRSRTTVSVNSYQRRKRFYITMVSEDTKADEKKRVSWAEWKKNGGDVTICSPRGDSGWLYRWPRKQKYPSEDRQSYNLPDNISSNEGRVQQCWRNTAC